MNPESKGKNYIPAISDGKGVTVAKKNSGYKEPTKVSEPLKRTAPLTDQEYKNTTGRTRSTLLGG